MTDPGASPNSVLPSPFRKSLLGLPLWHRFHVRLTLLYGLVVLVALGVITATVYVGGVDLAMTGIRGRLEATAVSLARGIDLDALAQLRQASDKATPGYAALESYSTTLSQTETDLLSLYVLVPTTEPGLYTFAFDHVAPAKHGAPRAEVGQSYDGRKNLDLQRGLTEPTVETEIASDAWGDSLSGYAPVIDRGGKHVAIVGVDCDANSIRRMKRRVLLASMLLALFAATLLGIAAFLVGHSVHDPLVRVINAASAISGGRLDARVGLSRQDEFGLLGKHFDDMAAGLQERDRIRATFGRYVSEDVARRVLNSAEGAKMGGEVRTVSVLFSDLRGYSTISETLSPTETIELLNEYLSVMNRAIDAEGGCIIEFLGDAILAVFGAPEALEAHPARAVRCAMAMREGLVAFNERMCLEGRAPWLQKGMAGLGQRIGIHTGEVLAGNLGSDVRVKYAVIGDAVNVASRCEGLNKTLGTEILCTASTWTLLPDDLRTKLVDKGAHDVKGRTGKVFVYAA